jgi:predicted RNA-binding protein with PUA domain
VLILSTQGFVVQGEIFGMAIFDSNIRYRFEIENTGERSRFS